MMEIATEVSQYFQENLPLSLVIALAVGFLASKTVTHWEKSNIFVYFLIGALGSFLGQFVERYIGLKEVLDQVAAMTLLFDVVIAYLGSFVIAAIAHLFKPM
jgi:uncharacterized membrane protein YeaQ/YmgE (transglycosylase-associated protein family)